VVTPNIVCSICGARPWPADTSIPQSLDLLLTADGWVCERHPRAAAVSPFDQAVRAFDALLDKEIARLAKAIGHSKALDVFRCELGLWFVDHCRKGTPPGA
jgi:hypothetical protein